MLLIIFNNLLTFINKLYCLHVLRWVFGILAFVTELSLSLSVWKMCVECHEIGTLVGKPSSVHPPNSLNVCIGRFDHMCQHMVRCCSPAKKHSVCSQCSETFPAVILPHCRYLLWYQIQELVTAWISLSHALLTHLLVFCLFFFFSLFCLPDLS